MRTQFNIPTQPMRLLFDGSQRCCGACQQGRAACPHPMVCGSTLTDAELADAVAELTTDHAPLTPAEKRAAVEGVATGLADRLRAARDYLVAAWRAL